MELASCLKTITELWSTSVGGSSKKDDDKSQGQSKPLRHIVAGVWRAGRMERDEIEERKMTEDTYNQQSDGICTSKLKTALSHRPAVLLQWEEKGCGKVCPKGLIYTSYLECVSCCSCGNPTVQHVSSMLPLKRETSHLRKQFIFGSGNTALTNMLQASCYYNFTAYCQSAIWTYINAAFDGSPGRRSDTTVITVAGDTHNKMQCEFTATWNG